MTENEPLENQTAEDLNQDRIDEEDHFHLEPQQAAAALEAILFAAGDPIPIEKIQQITGLDRQDLQAVLDHLSSKLKQDPQRGLLIREIDGQYFMCTKPDLREVLQRLFRPRQRPQLSQAAYETLAIIAYNQPVTRAQVEAVRGVNSDSIVTRLVERGLVEETGHLDAPGRPLLYETTRQFLLDFGLRSVKDLPPMELLMYGTLRDFESSLKNATSESDERQMTIDQLVQAYIPSERSNQEKTSTDQADASDSDVPSRPENVEDDDLFAVSGVLFGYEKRDQEKNPEEESDDRSSDDRS